MALAVLAFVMARKAYEMNLDEKIKFLPNRYWLKQGGLLLARIGLDGKKEDKVWTTRKRTLTLKMILS